MFNNAILALIFTLTKNDILLKKDNIYNKEENA